MRVWEDLLSEHDRRCLANLPRSRKQGQLGTRPALLVIDMQLAAIGEDRPVYEQQDKYPRACGNFAWAAIRHLQKLILVAREAGIPIVYSRNVVRPESGLASPPHLPWRADNPQSELIKEFTPTEGDIYVEKTRASVFFQTPLIYILLGRNIDTLLITGNSTSGCVRASALDGAGYNFRVAVIEECIFDRLELSHKASLFDLWFKYCDVISIGETYEYMERLKKSRQ